jgi:hypothetical protein
MSRWHRERATPQRALLGARGTGRWKTGFQFLDLLDSLRTKEEHNFRRRKIPRAKL